MGRFYGATYRSFLLLPATVISSLCLGIREVDGLTSGGANNARALTPVTTKTDMAKRTVVGPAGGPGLRHLRCV